MRKGVSSVTAAAMTAEKTTTTITPAAMTAEEMTNAPAEPPPPPDLLAGAVDEGKPAPEGDGDGDAEGAGDEPEPPATVPAAPEGDGAGDNDDDGEGEGDEPEPPATVPAAPEGDGDGDGDDNDGDEGEATPAETPATTDEGEATPAETPATTDPHLNVKPCARACDLQETVDELGSLTAIVQLMKRVIDDHRHGVCSGDGGGCVQRAVAVPRVNWTREIDNCNRLIRGTQLCPPCVKHGGGC